MLLEPLLDQLTALGLNGCRAALEARQQNSQYADLTFEDRLGLLLEVECTRRADKRLQRRVKNARFALPATIEDVKFSPTRGLDRRRVLDLAQAAWIPRHLNVFVLGPTGAGKTFLACALGQAVCRQGFNVRYERTSRLLHQLHLAQTDGSYGIGKAGRRLLTMGTASRLPNQSCGIRAKTRGKYSAGPLRQQRR